MGFNESLLMRRRDELNDKGVQIRFAGRRDWRVPRRVLRRMDESIELTKHNRTMTLTMAFNYGGRAEIVDAVKALMAEGIPPDKVDEKAIRRHLYYPDMPDPDLVIRTSGETRISNFLLWEIAYSELIFPEVLWPDVRRAPPLRGHHRVPAAGAPLRCGESVRLHENGAVTFTRIALMAGTLLVAGFFVVVMVGVGPRRHPGGGPGGARRPHRGAATSCTARTRTGPWPRPASAPAQEAQNRAIDEAHAARRQARLEAREQARVQGSTRWTPAPVGPPPSRRGRRAVSLFRDTGVVLRTYRLGEADRIIVLMTEEHGKVRAVAKGVRRTSSKFGARLEPLTHVDLLLWQGRSDLDIVNQVEVIDTYRSVREDLHRVAKGLALLEVTDQMAQERHPDRRLYAMLVGALARPVGRRRRPHAAGAVVLPQGARARRCLARARCVRLVRRARRRRRAGRLRPGRGRCALPPLPPGPPDERGRPGPVAAHPGR